MVDCAGSQGLGCCGTLMGELVASLIIIIISRLNGSSALHWFQIADFLRCKRSSILGQKVVRGEGHNA